VSDKGNRGTPYSALLKQGRRPAKEADGRAGVRTGKKRMGSCNGCHRG